jgi:hypothetical protein
LVFFIPANSKFGGSQTSVDDASERCPMPDFERFNPSDWAQNKVICLILPINRLIFS